MGQTLELSAQNFKETIGKDGATVFIDWWAPWCAPCRGFAPIYEQAATKHPDITFAKINTEDHPELSGAAEIRAIPTLMVFRDGILLFRHEGAIPAAALDDLVAQVRKVDMDAVRKEIAKSQAQPESSQS